jgi:hypothetical protein
LPTCYALFGMNVICMLQHVWAGGCGRMPRPQLIMQLRFSTSWSRNSRNSACNGAPIECTTSIHSTQLFVNVPHTFFLCHQEFSYSSLFVTCVRHRRHFHTLLRWRFLLDDQVLTHMFAININVATPQFSHCYLYSGMRKKLLGNTFWAFRTLQFVAHLWWNHTHFIKIWLQVCFHHWLEVLISNSLLIFGNVWWEMMSYSDCIATNLPTCISPCDTTLWPVCKLYCYH